MTEGGTGKAGQSGKENRLEGPKEQSVTDVGREKPEESGTISVTVHYQSKDATKAFSPSTSIEEILDWALEFTEFAIDPAMVNEFALARHGDKDELALGDHLGKLAKGAKAIALDLVRGDIANGAV